MHTVLVLIEAPTPEDVSRIRGGFTLRGGFDRKEARDLLVLRGLNIDVRSCHEDLIQDARSMEGREHSRTTFADQVPDAELLEQPLVYSNEAERIDSLFARAKRLDPVPIAALRAKEPSAGLGGDDDHRELWCVEHRDIEVEPAGLGVHDLERETGPPLAPPKHIQGLSELSAQVIGGADKIGLITGV